VRLAEDDGAERVRVSSPPPPPSPFSPLWLLPYDELLHPMA
jgi:hypothetical protein